MGSSYTCIKHPSVSPSSHRRDLPVALLRDALSAIDFTSQMYLQSQTPLFTNYDFFYQIHNGRIIGVAGSLHDHLHPSAFSIGVHCSLQNLTNAHIISLSQPQLDLLQKALQDAAGISASAPSASVCSSFATSCSFGSGESSALVETSKGKMTI